MTKDYKLKDFCKKESSNIAQKDLENNQGKFPIYGASGLIKYVDFYKQEKPYIAVVKDGAGVGRVMKLPPYSSVIGTLQYIIPNDDVNVDYLAYAMENMKLSKYYMGAAIPHIYFKDYCNEAMPLHSAKEQHEIATNLDKVNKLIDFRNRQLSKLDELVKARFVELFGDSKKYQKEPLNDNVEQMFIGPFGSALKNECFVDEDSAYCMVYEQKHAIQKTMDLPTRYVNEMKYQELKRFEVHGGDIIVSCRGTIGEIYSIPDDAPMGIMHPSIMKIRLKKEKYCNLFFVFLLEEFMRESIKKANGSGIKMAITATELGKELFVVPTLEQQNKFSDFVKQIDKSKLSIQQSLEKLETLKKSLMQQYFG